MIYNEGCKTRKKYTKYNLENNVLENYSDDFNQECVFL